MKGKLIYYVMLTKTPSNIVTGTLRLLKTGAHEHGRRQFTLDNAMILLDIHN